MSIKSSETHIMDGQQPFNFITQESQNRCGAHQMNSGNPGTSSGPSSRMRTELSQHPQSHHGENIPETSSMSMMQTTNQPEISNPDATQSSANTHDAQSLQPTQGSINPANRQNPQSYPVQRYFVPHPQMMHLFRGPWPGVVPHLHPNISHGTLIICHSHAMNHQFQRNFSSLAPCLNSATASRVRHPHLSLSPVFPALVSSPGQWRQPCSGHSKNKPHRNTKPEQDLSEPGQSRSSQVTETLGSEVSVGAEVTPSGEDTLGSKVSDGTEVAPGGEETVGSKVTPGGKDTKWSKVNDGTEVTPGGEETLGLKVSDGARVTPGGEEILGLRVSDGTEVTPSGEEDICNIEDHLDMNFMNFLLSLDISDNSLNDYFNIPPDSVAEILGSEEQIQSSSAGTRKWEMTAEDQGEMPGKSSSDLQPDSSPYPGADLGLPQEIKGKRKSKTRIWDTGTDDQEEMPGKSSSDLQSDSIPFPSTELGLPLEIEGKRKCETRIWETASDDHDEGSGKSLSDPNPDSSTFSETNLSFPQEIKGKRKRKTRIWETATDEQDEMPGKSLSDLQPDSDPFLGIDLGLPQEIKGKRNSKTRKWEAVTEDQDQMPGKSSSDLQTDSSPCPGTDLRFPQEVKGKRKCKTRNWETATDEGPGKSSSDLQPDSNSFPVTDPHLPQEKVGKRSSKKRKWETAADDQGERPGKTQQGATRPGGRAQQTRKLIEKMPQIQKRGDEFSSVSEAGIQSSSALQPDYSPSAGTDLPLPQKIKGKRKSKTQKWETTAEDQGKRPGKTRPEGRAQQTKKLSQNQNRGDLFPIEFSRVTPESVTGSSISEAGIQSPSSVQPYSSPFPCTDLSFPQKIKGKRKRKTRIWETGTDDQEEGSGKSSDLQPDSSPFPGTDLSFPQKIKGKRKRRTRIWETGTDDQDEEPGKPSSDLQPDSSPFPGTDFSFPQEIKGKRKRKTRIWETGTDKMPGMSSSALEPDSSTSAAKTQETTG